jgi:hypothetical protein
MGEKRQEDRNTEYSKAVRDRGPKGGGEASARCEGVADGHPVLVEPGGLALIKNKIKFSSYIRKFRVEQLQLQSHI